ncbi:hypothetical protein IV694_004358 [Salmonella enterica]|nr:hypothetical protein [Salmonella enterica]
MKIKGSIYIGKHCIKCGNQERYQSNKRCVACKLKLDTARNERVRLQKQALKRHDIE